MHSFFSFYTIFIIPFLAYGSALFLNRAIARGYKRNHNELEFPHKLTRQQARRRILYLAGGLLIPYGFAFAAATTWSALFIYLLYMAILVAITVMDFEQQIILDEFILALIVLSIIALFFVPPELLSRVVAGAGGFALFMLIAVVTHGGIGGGDIKLVGALGLFLGINRIIFTVVCGILAGGIVSLILLLTKRKGRKDAIAYGPYFAMAAMLALFWH